MIRREHLPKLTILLSTSYATLNLLHWPIGFTYFTQLSNLFLAAVVLMQLVKPDGRALPALKFGAVVSIIVTCFVFLTVLVPIMPGGLLAAYGQDHGASFCLHLLSPVLAVYDFFRHDAAYPYTRRHARLALVPPFLYCVFVLVLGRLGLRWGPDNMLAPYPFLNYGAPAGWFGFCPETADYSTLGIGVFYAAIGLLALFYAAARALLGLAERHFATPHG